MSDRTVERSEKDRQRVVVRFADGRIIRGYIDDFLPSYDFVLIEDESSEKKKISINELKAIFYVRTFEGDRQYSDRKSFRGPGPTGKRIFVRFKDGESMMGYVEGDLPWRRGFFLEQQKNSGFFLIPVDSECNNIRVFVITAAVRDVTAIG